MVYYFTSTVVDPPAYVYVGKDKFESACNRLNFAQAANEWHTTYENLFSNR